MAAGPKTSFPLSGSMNEEECCCVVVVLNLNGRDLLNSCLDSLAKQSYANLRVSVVDNGSIDGSREMVSELHPHVRFLALSENLGFSLANNIAIRDALARGAQYVLLLNNDTIAAPEMAEEMIRAMEADPRIAAVCPKIYFAGEPGKLWYAGGEFSLWTTRSFHRGWKQRDEGQFDLDLNVSVATGCAVLLRASALRDVGLLDETLWAYLEDVEWSIRFLKKGYRLRFAPKAKLWHWDGATWVRSLASGSQAKRQYYSTRNLMLIGWRHTRWYQVPSFILGFLVYELFFYTVLRIWRRDFRALWAIYRGVAAAVRYILFQRALLSRSYSVEDCG